MAGLSNLLGHLHPLAVHLPIGIFLLLAVLELMDWLRRSGRSPGLPALSENLRGAILALGAIAAVLSAAFGWLLARGGDYDVEMVHRHRIFGLAVAALALVAFGLHGLRWTRLRTGTFVCTLALLFAAGHSGGSLTHGSGFLTDALPAKLRGLGAKAQAAKGPPPSLQEAVVFADLIQPILEEKCAGCHGPNKSNGHLRLDSWTALTQGGKHGSVVKAGDEKASSLLQRMLLATDEKEHMPPAVKPQPSDDDIALIQWWIDVGSPVAKKVAEVDAPPEIADLIGARLGTKAPEEPLPERAATLARAAALADRLGISIHPLTPEGPLVQVSARLRAGGFGDPELAQLLPIAPVIAELDLGDTAISDQGLALLKRMARLRKLALDGTGLTDRGLVQLTGLSRLVSLNLVGTTVTDTGLATLGTLPSLRSLYLWRTNVTQKAAQTLAVRYSDERKMRRWQSEIIGVEDKMRADTFHFDMGDTPTLVPTVPQKSLSKSP